MAKILIAECKQEVSTFNPAPSHYTDFMIYRGAQVIEHHRRVRNEVAGALSLFDGRDDVDLAPVISARAITSGGTLAAADWTKLAHEIVTSLQACKDAGEIDAAYFCLHGAMSAENECDPEGYLLQEARRIFGEHIPIVASFDLHGILTDRMMQHCDAIVCYHTYPHVDLFETGARAAKALLRIIDGAKPVMAKVYVPALVRGDELITASGSIRFPVNAAKELEAKGALSAGLFWGNPFTDVPDLATYSFVVTDGDEEMAKREAMRIAELFWQHHEKMQVPLTSMDDAVKRANETKEGTVILVDAADATSSGASGDSNAILRKLVEAGYTGKALIPIVDAPAADAAFKAGVGDTIRVTVGGTLDPQRFTPLPVEGYVQMLSDGLFQSESYGESWFAGKTAVLLVDHFTLIVTSRPVSLYDRSLFYAHGQDPQRFNCVVVKSPHCQPHMFQDWAARYINVDAPGATSANLKSLGHTQCPRPIFPLDEGVTWAPAVKVFRRDA
jgi:microcystin degradation protein MlrC